MDFFQQMQRIANTSLRAKVDCVLEDVRGLFGTLSRPGLELVFSTVDEYSNLLKVIGDVKGRHQDDMRQIRDRLVEAIRFVLGSALTVDGNPDNVAPCALHRRLVDLLVLSDTMISFNYDCILDYALKYHGNDKWLPQQGYGLKLAPKGNDKLGFKFWNPSSLPPRNESVHLYKLHGSLNFVVDPDRTGGLRLIDKPYDISSPTPALIPPISNKGYGVNPWKILWQKAASTLQNASTIVFIGYSLPPTDLHARALLWINLRRYNSPLKSIIVVNPDQTARTRTLEACAQGIDAHTRIYEFESLLGLLELHRHEWDTEVQAVYDLRSSGVSNSFGSGLVNLQPSVDSK